MPRLGSPPDVLAIRAEITKALNATDSTGKKVGDAKFGIYAFYDYDGEPIYVGQTREKLRTRVRRHLTNQRTDAVAMNVLDPFEVYEVEFWALWDLENRESQAVAEYLNSAEFSVFQKLLAASSYNAILNEKDIVEAPQIDLPRSVRACIIPEAMKMDRKHPDVRIARRATTIASLAKVISERDVSPGLRRTLHTQARRLERLAAIRFDDFADQPIASDGPDSD